MRLTLHHDSSLGSVVALTKSDGSAAESNRYHAWRAGGPRREREHQLVADRVHEFEEGSGLYYFRLRQYDPKIGRFISRDPKGLWGDSGQLGNGQSAFGNNPLNRIDPLGLDAFVRIDHNTKEIDVTVEIDLYVDDKTGFAATSKAISDAIDKYWNRKGGAGAFKTGGGYTVRFKADIRRGDPKYTRNPSDPCSDAIDTKHDFVKRADSDKNTRDIVRVYRGSDPDHGEGFTTTQYTPKERKAGMGSVHRVQIATDATGAFDEEAIAHEFGRQLGLGKKSSPFTVERDGERINVELPNKGCTDDIMAYHWWQKFRRGLAAKWHVSQDSIDELSKALPGAVRGDK